MKIIILSLLIGLTCVFANVPCGDGSFCPDNSTCCSLNSDRFGCCPYKNAECCSDHQHCCPGGYKCDLAHQQCVREVGTNEFLAYVGLMEKVESNSLPVELKEKDIGKCIQDLEGIVQDGERIYKDVQSKDFPDLFSAVQQLVQDAESAIADCQSLVKVDLREEGVVDCISDVEHLIVDGTTIYNDIAAKNYAKLISDAENLIHDGIKTFNDCKSLVK